MSFFGWGGDISFIQNQKHATKNLTVQMFNLFSNKTTFIKKKKAFATLKKIYTVRVNLFKKIILFGLKGLKIC